MSLEMNEADYLEGLAVGLAGAGGLVVFAEWMLFVTSFVAIICLTRSYVLRRRNRDEPSAENTTETPQ